MTRPQRCLHVGSARHNCARPPPGRLLIDSGTSPRRERREQRAAASRPHWAAGPRGARGRRRAVTGAPRPARSAAEAGLAGREVGAELARRALPVPLPHLPRSASAPEPDASTAWATWLTTAAGCSTSATSSSPTRSAASAPTAPTPGALVEQLQNLRAKGIKALPTASSPAIASRHCPTAVRQALRRMVRLQ